MTTATKTGKEGLILLGYIVVAVPLIVLRGFVYTKLWGWFVVPFGLPAITIVWATGLALMLGLSRAKADFTAKDSTTFGQRIANQIATSVVNSLLAWGFGAVIAHWM